MFSGVQSETSWLNDKHVRAERQIRAQDPRVAAIRLWHRVGHRETGQVLGNVRVQLAAVVRRRERRVADGHLPRGHARAEAGAAGAAIVRHQLADGGGLQAAQEVP